ncbi:hypothetical protein THASP1DRAFT_24020, partial [Thamnocephalis sphaerospora]
IDTIKLTLFALAQIVAAIIAVTKDVQGTLVDNALDDLVRNPMQHLFSNGQHSHLFRDGRHLMRNSENKPWIFLRCEASPFARRDEHEQGKGMDVPHTEEWGDGGVIRASCDGGLTWE